MTDALADSVQRALGDGYRVDRELGGGGMSRVFVAHDLSLDRDVVIKVLSEEATAGVSAERFRREIQVIAKLQHPHVVSILSAGSASGSLYYMMPFVTGETLRARLARQGPLPVSDVVRLLREVLDALDFAHEHGVVHRDVKPENVLIGAGHAVVADFGIAKALRESGTLTSAGFAIGTPAYMAPEQATADPTTDHRADLYSVGVLGYELLAGEAPFSGTSQQVITAHLTTPPAPIQAKRPDVPDALAGVIMRALAKDPALRPQTAREMMSALESVATPALHAARGAKPSRRALAATLALLVVAVAVFAVRSRAKAVPAPTVALGTDLIAVMPLSAVSDSSLARLGQDLVVTLSTNLDGVCSLHTVDAVTLLMRARKATSPLPLADARRMAGELGARSVLTGTLINEGERVRASIALHRVGSDSAIATASAVAAPRDIAALTDSLTWGILRQIWQRGTPPSPVLTGLTTKSVAALRAFLEGERHFQRLESDAALGDYRRAFELDSTFVQAFLRYDFVNTWAQNADDEEVAARLLSLKDRLPQRERLWLEARESKLPLPAHVDLWKKLADRYPDYPPVLMGAADPILHSGPLVGIPISDAQPYLDRLEQLVPEHGDTRFHRVVVDLALGTSDSTAVSLRNAARVLGSPWNTMLDWLSELFAADARGTAPPMDSALAVGRVLAEGSSTDKGFRALSGLMGLESPNAGPRLAALERVRAAGIFSGDMERSSALGEGTLRASRGDWTGAVHALRRAESSRLSYGDRITSARVAALGRFVDAVDAATADSALQRVRAMRAGDATPFDRVELEWIDGLLGVLAGDGPRAKRAERALRADTAMAAHYAARSLAGLWLGRTNPSAGADTLRATSDDAMRSGEMLLPAEAVDRLVVARELRRRGVPAEAERYLMWTDAGLNLARNISVKLPLSGVVFYERALALEEAGDRQAAAYQLRRMLTAYDQAPPAHRALVDDARRRLAQLEATDAPGVRPVAPR